MCICKDNHLIFDFFNKVMKCSVINISSITSPSDNQTKLIHKGAYLYTNNPAMIRNSFLPNLPWASSFTDRMNKLDSIGIDKPQYRRLSQEVICPISMLFEKAEEACSLRQFRKLGPVIIGNPSIESPISNPLYCEQYCCCDNLAWIKTCSLVLFYAFTLASHHLHGRTIL